MAVSAEQIDDMYTQITLGRSKADYGPLDPEASALWDRIAEEVALVADGHGDLLVMVDPEWSELPPWVVEAPEARPAPQTPTASISAHLSGKHDQRRHGRGRGGGRAGMGDIELDAKTVKNMQGGSAGPHIVERPDGTFGFTPERQALHDDIVNEALEGKTPSGGQPRYDVMGGGPAAGKSHFLRSEAGSHLEDGPHRVKIDSDKIKEQLPETTRMIAEGDRKWAEFSHEESSYVAKRVQAASFENRLDVTLDGTGDSEPGKLRGKIGAAKAAGYRVEGHYVTIDTDTAVTRAKVRAEEMERAGITGRVVPPAVVRHTHQVVSATATEVYTDFDAFDLYDTSADSLSHVMTYRDGATSILNQGQWDQFVAKGSG